MVGKTTNVKNAKNVQKSSPVKTSKTASEKAPSEKLWRKILKNHPEANFLQSPEWAKVNREIGHKVLVETFGEDALALMIIKNARRGRYLEIPGGPLLNWDDAGQVEAAFSRLRAIAKENHCAFIRFRPQLENTPENLKKLEPTGSKPAPFHLHAEHTVMIDLEKSEDDLLADMRRQTRYEVRRATKLGLTVEKGNSKELFEEFHKIQSATAARQHFIPPRLSDLLAYHNAFGDNAEIYVAYDGKPIALGLIIKSGPEADYFEAASTDLNRKLPGAYALQWQAMKDLKKQGIKRYNLWGIAPPNQPNHRYARVTTFKTGFGGRQVEFISAQDIVINRIKYLKTYLVETIRKKRRHLS